MHDLVHLTIGLFSDFFALLELVVHVLVGIARQGTILILVIRIVGVWLREGHMVLVVALELLVASGVTL